MLLDMVTKIKNSKEKKNSDYSTTIEPFLKKKNSAFPLQLGFTENHNFRHILPLQCGSNTVCSKLVGITKNY